jgi:hypothetical protein
MFGGGPCCFPRCLVGVRVVFPRCLVGVRVVSPDVWWGSVLVIFLGFYVLFCLSSCCVLSAQCCQGLCTVHSCCQGLCTVHCWLPNVVRVSVLPIPECPMLSGSLYCPFLIAQCCQGLCTVHSWLPNSVSLTSIYKCTGASNVSIPTYDSRHICGKSLTNIS